MKVLILGASGYAGQAIARQLEKDHEVYGTYYTQTEHYLGKDRMFQYKLGDTDLKSLLDRVRPQIVISSLRGDFQLQSAAHKAIVEYLMANENGKIIYISTANVFDADDMVISSRLEMLKIVNGLPENAVFDEDFINSTKEYFRSPYQTTVLSVNGNEVVGCATICYITVMPTFDHPSGKRAHIMNVYTRDNYRRQGIAFRMMEMLIQEAKQKGVSEISLDATELGRPLYKKCGFMNTQEGMVLNLQSH